MKDNGEVLDRDEHKCVICGSEENLIVHHIIPAREFSIIVNPPVKPHEKDNLATLCNKCHHYVHKGNFGESSIGVGVVYNNRKEFWKLAENPEKFEKKKIEIEMEDVKGVGKSISEKLFEKFGTLEDLRQAETKNLLEVPYVVESIARRIKCHLSNQVEVPSLSNSGR